jgi:hypothetical protein
MDAWRQRYFPVLFKGMIQAGGLLVTEIARRVSGCTEFDGREISLFDGVWKRRAAKEERCVSAASGLVWAADYAGSRFPHI